jgi:hypothetical protein
MNWDFARGQEIDLAAVAGYVRQAVDLQGHYREHSAEISAASKATATKAAPAKAPRRR